jgi:hypothetical protein
MSLYVSTCTSYDFKALMPGVEVVNTSHSKNEWVAFRAANQHYILSEVRKECKWHLCNAEAYGRETMKKSSVSEWHTWFSYSFHVKITNRDNAHHFLQYQGFCSLWIHYTRPVSQPSLWGNTEAVMRNCTEKDLNSGLIRFSAMTMLQLTKHCQAVLTEKSITKMEHPPNSPDLAPNYFWQFPKIVCL